MRKVRWTLWPVLVIGVILIVAPLVISLPSKGSAGQKMLNNFHSMMQPAAVKTTQNYFTDFEALRPVAQGGVAAASEIPVMLGQIAAGMHMSQAQLSAYMAKQFPAMTSLLGALPQMTSVFKQVPPGLDWYKPIIATMAANQSNYSQVDSLPNFNLFTWFFEIPGILLVLLAIAGLMALRRE